MGNKGGRPKEGTIHPNSDPTKDKVTMSFRINPDDKDILEEKIEDRGYENNSTWFREEAEKLIMDRDVKEKIEDLKEERKSKQDEIEEIKEEIQKLKSKLKDQEKKRQKIYKTLESKIVKELDGKNELSVEEIKGLISKLSKLDEVSILKEDKAKQIFLQNQSEVTRGSMNQKDLPRNILDEWKDEGVLIMEGYE